MQKIIEPIVFIIYLTLILITSRYMIIESLGNTLYKTFGVFGLTLALTDGIYIIPRMYAVLTTGLEDNLRILGWGRLGNSIIVTILFLVLYDIYNLRYSKRKKRDLDKTIYLLSGIRVFLCLLPGNKYFELIPNHKYAIIRFIPILIIGLLLILVIFVHSKKYRDKSFMLLGIAAAISILLLEPLVYSRSSIIITILTIIRTIALVAILLIGYRELRDINVLSRY